MPDVYRVVVVLNNFPRIAAELPVKAEAIVAATAQAIAGAASAGAPRLTGELAGSIQAHSVGLAHWEVTANSGHAAYVEYGTAKHGGPQPYMVPAAHQEEPNFDSNMRNIVQ